jgi:formylglycine-generating enzyme required for sulfatase activity
MVGNVREWVLDDFDPGFYARSPRLDPVGKLDAVAFESHVVRGGSFASKSSLCRTYAREQAEASFHSWDLGFRVARAAR